MASSHQDLARFTPDFQRMYGDLSRDVTRQVAELASLNSGKGGFGYAGSHKVITIADITNGKLGQGEKARLDALVAEKDSGDAGRGRRGSREGFVEAVPLLRRYDTRCFAMDHGDGDDVELVVASDSGVKYRDGSPASQSRVRTSHVHRDVRDVQQQQERKRKPSPKVPEPQYAMEPQHQPQHQPQYQPQYPGGYVDHGGYAGYGAPQYGGYSGGYYDQGYGGYGHQGGYEPVAPAAPVPAAKKPKQEPTFTSHPKVPTQLTPAQQAALEKARMAKMSSLSTLEQTGGEYRPPALYDIDPLEAMKQGRKPRLARASDGPIEVMIDGKKITLPLGWKMYHAPIGPIGMIPPGKQGPTTPLYISPEGIVCWSVDMMEGCESTRARGVLKFERSLTSLRLDMQRLCKEPLLDAVSGRAIGRDSVMRYRASYALYLKKLGCLRK